MRPIQFPNVNVFDEFFVELTRRCDAEPYEAAFAWMVERLSEVSLFSEIGGEGIFQADLGGKAHNLIVIEVDPDGEELMEEALDALGTPPFPEGVPFFFVLDGERRMGVDTEGQTYLHG